MKNMIEALEWRYAVKKFDSEATLTTEQLDAVKQAFNLSASSYGLQPYSLVLIQNKEVQASLVPHSYGQQQVAQASALLVFCIRTDFNAAYIDAFFNLTAEARGQALESLEGYKNFMKSSFENKTEEEIMNWASKQVYLTMGTLLAACAAMGIDSCPMEGFNAAAYDQELGLASQNLRSVLAMPIGIRSSEDPVAGLKKVRKPLEASIVTIA